MRQPDFERRLSSHMLAEQLHCASDGSTRILHADNVNRPMPAYFRSSIARFLNTNEDTIIGKLQAAYAIDGYQSQYTKQTTAWVDTMPALSRTFRQLLLTVPEAANWHVLLEYPLYRLRRRIDAVILAPNIVFVLELKTGAKKFEAADRRQVEEYAQDLRDFHAQSRHMRLQPILWAFEALPVPWTSAEPDHQPGVGKLALVGQQGLDSMLTAQSDNRVTWSNEDAELFAEEWDGAAYQPVPSVIEAATALFAGHGVREITVANAKNLSEAAAKMLDIIKHSRDRSEHAVVFLTGVPGAGKTLAGLNVVHTAIHDGVERKGEIVYLSGNTPLVIVLREALALDRHKNASATTERVTLGKARDEMRVTVQHINDFLVQYVRAVAHAPAEHVIVFDEAQRAWNAKQGQEKFNRNASEPLLVLETMARHPDWSVSICLIGSGQEINDGEEGVKGWADAIATVAKALPSRWKVYGPEAIFGARASSSSLGELPGGIACNKTNELHLEVPMRSFRSPELGEWIKRVIDSDPGAAQVAKDLSFPLRITRSLPEAKAWLKELTRGERRMGLLASSGARRLRAEGLGQLLSATDGQAIAQWYLNPPGDIRSSFALEVPANEYTSQGLEIDFACLCWGGDLIYQNNAWVPRSLAGNKWSLVGKENEAKRLFVLNSYRVLLSRAREGMVIWVPRGDSADHTRRPEEFDAVAACLISAGVVPL